MFRCFTVLNETSLIHARIQGYINVNILWSSSKMPDFLSDFNRTQTVWTDFNKSPHYKSSRNSFQWEPRFSMQAEEKKEGRAGITKLTVPFCKFAALHKRYM
jgi:hypothetical protein